MKKDKDTQKYCGLLNKMYCFTIYYQNKRPETVKAFERERNRNLKGHHLYYTGLTLPSRRQNPFGYFFFLFFFLKLGA